MLKKIKKILQENYFLLIIALIAIFICILNYSPSTWLTGWDTLHPEFDFCLNLKREIFGVWSEYQGLGAISGHSHMADLPRILILNLFSVILPLNFLRYFYFFLCLILGPLGAFFFIEKIIFAKSQEKSTKMAAFLGGLFYLFNLGTLQHYYVPFEMFATLYAFLPWLLFFSTKFLTENKKSNLVIFSLITFLAIPMAYAATLWYVYFSGLIIYLFSIYLLNGRFHIYFKRIVLLIFITLLINSYWLLPNLYFLSSSAKNVPLAKINLMFSGEALSHDLKHANVFEAIRLKGFLFDWQEFRNGKFQPLLNEWQNHLNLKPIILIGWLISLLILFGFLVSFIKKNKFIYALLPLFVFSLIFLIYSHFPLYNIFSFIRSRSSIFDESLRFPWTKFSILVMFCFVCFFAFSINTIAEFFKKKMGLKILLFFISFLILIFSMIPVFSGNLINPSKRISIPEEYFAVYSWSKKLNKSERVTFFPIQTFRGWELYKWGFEGAGFVWFGLDQPILVRDFDRWSPKNENYYWEISYALYSKNQELFEKVLEKYQINWLLVDGNVINPSSPKALFFDELEEMISKSNKISLAQEFGKIKIYQVNLQTSVKDFVFLAENLPAIGPNYQWNNFDQAYSKLGPYITDNQLSGEARSRFARLIPNYQTFYPFRSLFTGRSQSDLEFELDDRGNYYIFKNPIPESLKNYQLLIPKDTQELVWIDPQDLSKVRYLKPEVSIKENGVEVKVPKVGGYYGAEIDPTKELTVQKAINCQEYLNGQVKNEIIEENGQKYLRLFSLDAKNCGTAFWLPNLNHRLSYLITIESRNLEGKSLLFWLENLNSRKADLETYLPKDSKILTSYFIQPVMEEDGLGYTLHFDNLSIGRVKSVNDLGKITVNPIPFKFLTSLKLVKPQTVVVEPQLHEPLKVSHPNPSYYEISINNLAIEQSNNLTLVLSQAYHDGWLAWEGKPFIGKRLQHVEVNNWENGWILPDHQTSTINHQPSISILFWPQLLEYFGFILLGGTLIGVGIYCLRMK